MPRYVATVLSPIHIGSGEQYEESYNMLQKNGFIHIYDEFAIGEFLLKERLLTAASAHNFKNLVKTNRDKIISSDIHIRKIQTELLVNKPMLGHATTQNSALISGSSVKGALRTAVLDSLINTPEKSKKILDSLKDKQITLKRFCDKGKNIETFDDDFINIFASLKVYDSIYNLKTKIYKTVNIKKIKEHQEDRGQKVLELENFVECIEPKQTFEIEIVDASEDKIFENLGVMCNAYGIPNYKKDSGYYFKAPSKMPKETADKLKELSNRRFLINIGRFGGAEQKTINGLKEIKTVKGSDKTTTTARTFALEKMAQNEIFFEKELLPFGWLLLEAAEQ